MFERMEKEHHFSKRILVMKKWRLTSMKKLMIICLTLALALTMLTACTQNQSGAQQDGQTAQQEQEKQPELQEIVQAVKDAYGENYLPSMQMDEQMMTDIYGVDMDNVEEFVAEGPMISAHVDTFIAVKAKEGKGEQVQQELQAYLDYVQENALQYPMNTAKVQAAQVVRHGDYVFYVMLGGYDERTDVTEEESVDFAKEQVQIGLDTIASFF